MFNLLQKIDEIRSLTRDGSSGPKFTDNLILGRPAISGNEAASLDQVASLLGNISFLRYATGTTRGTLNTKIVRYSLLVDSIGNEIVHSTSSLLGDWFDIKNNGVYSISAITCNDNPTDFQAEIRASSVSLDNNLQDSNTLSSNRDTTAAVATIPLPLNWCGFLRAGTKVWVSNNTTSNAAGNIGIYWNQITITKLLTVK